MLSEELRALLERRIRERQETIDILKRRVEVIERIFWPSPFDRYEKLRLLHSIRAFEGWQTRDRERLEEIPPPPPPPRYNIFEYVKYFDVIVVNPKKTPEISFELRGEFTIPVGVDPLSTKVLSLVEDRLKQAFEEWGKPWMKEEREFAPYEIPLVGIRYEPRIVEGRQMGYWAIKEMRGGGIDMRYFRQREDPTLTTYGEEPVGVTGTFSREVEVLIVKYKKGEDIGQWKRKVFVNEEDFM